MKPKTLPSIVVLFVLLLFTFQTFGQGIITGQVLYHNNPSKPLSAVNVYLLSSSNVYLDTAYTDASGTYLFDNLSSGEYKLQATTSQPSGGIQIDDAFLLLFYLCNMVQLTPLQKLAADVNGNGVVFWDDYLLLLFHWFINGYTFPAGNWAIQNVTVNVTPARGIEITNLGALSVGDINGTYQPGGKSDPYLILRNEKPLKASLADNLEIPFSLENQSIVGGGNLVINFPPEIIRVTGITSKIQGLCFGVQSNEVRIAWLDTTFLGVEFQPGESLFTLTVQVLNNKLSDGMDLKVGTNSLVVDQQGNRLPEMKLRAPGISFLHENLECYRSYPNPFTSSATIAYSLVNPCRVTVDIFDLKNNHVSELADSFQPEGDYKVDFNASGLQPGVYLYKITAFGAEITQVTGTMILTK